LVLGSWFFVFVLVFVLRFWVAHLTRSALEPVT
jgi:hypothetical protein